MRILVATDAWEPQVNGVVRTLRETAAAVEALGDHIDFLTPSGFRSFAMPTYRDIRLAICRPKAVARRIEAVRPDHIHIATEGTVGLAVRRYCRRAGVGFTTSYHTRFPEYVSARMPVPERFTYALLRWFHGGGLGTMVATRSARVELQKRGFRHLMSWSRGVDHGRFHPRTESVLDLPRPIFLSVGRVAVEKNIEAFLRLDLPGTKVVVGDGPARAALQAAYPDTRFLGMHAGEALAQIYASADVFVFPSRTDTFGIVILEALASGLPVAAYPVTGPLDVIGDSGAGALHEDLRKACLAALAIPRATALHHAAQFTWEASALQFLANIREARAGELAQKTVANPGADRERSRGARLKEPGKVG